MKGINMRLAKNIPGFVIFITIMLITTIVIPSDKIPPIGKVKLYPDTVLIKNNQPNCVIVYPSEQNVYAEAASKIAEAMKDKYQVEVAKFADNQICPERLTLIPEKYQQQNLILLGNVYNNRTIMPLYAGFWCGADGTYPGGNGYVLRTVSNPWGTGNNCIIIGSSNETGIGMAAANFIKRLPEINEGKVVLPRLLTVNPGGAMQSIIDGFNNYADNYQLKYPTNVYQEPVDSFATPAFRYHWTGDRRWAEIARKILLYIDQHYDDGYYHVSHYRFERFFRAWDIIEESGVFTADEIQRISQRMVETAFKAKGCQLYAPSKSMGGRHHSAHYMCPFIAANFILRNFPDSTELRNVAKNWQKWSNETFKYAVTGNRDNNDRYSCQDSIEVYLRWSLLSGNHTYFTTGLAKQGFLFLINYYDPLGYSCGMADYRDATPESVYDTKGMRYQCNLMGFVYDDPDIAWLSINDPVCKYGRTYFGPNVFGIDFSECHFAPPKNFIEKAEKPQYLCGMTALPMDKRRYDYHQIHKDKLPSLNNTIDKVWFRSGFQSNDQYLLLQGLQTRFGANCIPRFVDKGQIWLFHNTNEKGTFYRNGIFVSNGVNKSPEQKYFACSAENLARFKDLSLSRTTLKEYMGADWTRTIVWSNNKWFLVLDHIRPLQEDQYVFTCSWRLLHNAEWQNGTTLISTTGNHEFFIRSSAPVQASTTLWKKLEGAACPFFLRETRSGNFSANTTVDFQNLLYVKKKNTDTDFRPIRIDSHTVLIKENNRNPLIIGIGTGQPNSIGITANQGGIYILNPGKVYLSNINNLSINDKIVVNINDPITCEYNLEDKKCIYGVDEKQMFAASLSWKLPNETNTANIVTADPNDLAALITDIASQVKEPKNFLDNTADIDTSNIEDKLTLKTCAENKNATEINKIINSLIFHSDNIVGSKSVALDRIKEPVLRAPLKWERYVAPQFRLTCPNTEKLKEIVLYFWGYESDFFSQKERPKVAVTVNKSDSSAQNKSIEGKQYRFPVYKIVSKGKAHALGGLGIRLNGITADNLDVKLPFKIAWKYQHLKEIELLSENLTGAEIDLATVCDLENDGVNEIIVCYRNAVGQGIMKVFNENCQLLWSKSAKGEFTCISTGDIDGDGKTEILVTATDYTVRCFKSDGSLFWERNFFGLKKKSQGRHWPNGSVPTGVGIWTLKPGMIRIIVGGYCYMVLLDPLTGKSLNHLLFPNSRYAWKILKQQPDLDGDGLNEAFILFYVNNSSPGDVNIVSMKPNDKLSTFCYKLLISDGKYAAELTEGEKPKLSVIGPRGFGYYKTDRSLQGTKIYEIDLWSELFSRPISAGLLYDINSDGKKEFLIGGKDGFLSVFTRDKGKLISRAIIGKPVLDIIAFGKGKETVIIINTGQDLKLYNHEMKLLKTSPGQFVRLLKINDNDKTFAAFTKMGAMQIIKLSNPDA